MGEERVIFPSLFFFPSFFASLMRIGTSECSLSYGKGYKAGRKEGRKEGRGMDRWEEVGKVREKKDLLSILPDDAYKCASGATPVISDEG